MNIEMGTLNQALSGVVSGVLSGGKQMAEVCAQTAKNKNFLPTTAKRLLTSINSTLELPLKEFREMGSKPSHINAGTYS